MRVVSLVPAALLAVTVLTATPADAGGPTSVLLSVPGADSTTSLYYTDPRYDELADLVGVSQPDGTFSDEAGADERSQVPSGQRGAGVTLTWLIHDVEPWRVDRIVLAEDGPRISTQIWQGTRSLAQSPVVWHRPADPTALVSLLDRLGLDTKAAQEPGFEGVAGAPVPDGSTASARPARSSWATDAAWALPGLVVGVLITLLAGRLTLGRRRRPAGPASADRTDEPADVPAEVLVR